MANGLARELRELRPPSPAPVALPERDARARRPLLLSTLLRLDTLRRGLRVLTLLWLDVTGLFLAIWTALTIKAAIQDPDQLDLVRAQAEDVAPLATLVMVLLFARSGLYRDRPLRPGSTKVISSLFQTTIVVWLYAEIEGIEFSSYYLFYGSLFFALMYVSTFRWLFEKASGALLRAAGYRRRAVLVGAGANIEDVAEALSNSHAIEPFGYVSLTPHHSARLRDFGTLDTLERNFDAVDEVLIADPRVPPGRGRRAGRPLPPARRARARGPLDDGDPDGPDRVRPGPVACRCSSSSRPSSRASTSWSSAASTSSGSALLVLVLSPVLAADRAGRQGQLARARALPLAAPGDRRQAVRVPQVPHDERGRRAPAGRARAPQREGRRAVQDPRRPAGHARRAPSCAAGRSTSCRSCSTCCAARCRSSARDRCPQRDYDRLEDWHRKRNLVLPGMTGLWQVSGRSELDFDDLVRLDFLYLERWSVFLDLSILLKTVPAVLRARGAW